MSTALVSDGAATASMDAVSRASTALRASPAWLPAKLPLSSAAPLAGPLAAPAAEAPAAGGASAATGTGASEPAASPLAASEVAAPGADHTPCPWPAWPACAPAAPSSDDPAARVWWWRLATDARFFSGRCASATAASPLALALALALALGVAPWAGCFPCAAVCPLAPPCSPLLL